MKLRSQCDGGLSKHNVFIFCVIDVDNSCACAITIHPSLDGINGDCRLISAYWYCIIIGNIGSRSIWNGPSRPTEPVGPVGPCVPVSLSLVSLNSNLQNSTELTKNSFKWTKLTLHITSFLVFS